MQDEEKNDAVNAKFAVDYPELVGARNTINERGQIARKLLADEPEDVRVMFRKRAEDEYEESLDSFKSRGDGGFEDPELNEEERQDARARLGTTVQPLLDALCAHTGYHLTLLAGTVEGGRFDIRSVHSGKTKALTSEKEGKDFTRWDPAGYKERVMTQFMCYLAVAEEADPALLGSTQNVSASSSGPAPIQSTTPIESPTPSGAPTATPVPTTTLTPARTLNPTPMDTRVPTPSGVPSTPPPAPSTEDVRPPATPPPPPDDDMEGEGRGGSRENEESDADEDPLHHLTDIGSPLKRAVAKLQGDAQLSRIWELERASKYHRIRETNIARNNEALAALGLQQEMRELLNDVGAGKAGTKRKGAENAKGARAKRARRDDDEFGDSDEERDGNEEEGSGGEDSPAPRARTETLRPRPRRPGARSWPRTRVASDDTRETLQAGGGGEIWEKVVDMWWMREKAAAFGGPPKGPMANLWPKEVKGWVARARTGGPSPAIVDVYAFAASWWKWWVAINPPWRQLEGGNRLKKEGEGD
ncbi:hypothetical protein DFH06DRAFT_1344957 [Mycena polygramma]|nr:hypothetical protein DFH06DRAFT_1344957 [Mycena polygramma]